MALPFSPIAVRLQPRKIENTTICKISLCAMASTMLVGKACEINTFSVKGSDATTPVVSAPCATKLIPVPGMKKFTVIKPKAIDSNEAQINKKSVLEKIRPRALASPILAIPTTRVETTNGAIIIFISRKKIVVNIDISCA